MSTPNLPPELLDHIADHLQGTKESFRNYCLVSKSWVPRIRRLLFATINFDTIEKLRSWKKTFPDPSTSPAHHTKSLFFTCLQATGADAEVGSWIECFSRVVRLGVMTLSECTTR